MDYKKIIADTKAFFFSKIKKEETKLEDVKGKDAIYQTGEEGLVIDGTISRIETDGTLIQIMDEDIPLEDGRLVVVKEGKIVEIKDAPSEEPDTEETPTEETPMQEEIPTETTEEMPTEPGLETKIEEIYGALQMLLEAVQQIDQRVSALENGSDFEEKFSKISDEIKLLKEKPVLASVRKNEEKVEETDPYILRLRALKNKKN